MVARPICFLDRDGVLNLPRVHRGKSFAPRSREDFHLLPGVKEACRALKVAGYRLVVITNQPDLANGLIERSEMEAIHDRLRTQIAPDAIFVCPHAADAACNCRKPATALFLQALQQFSGDPQHSLMVGDRRSDIEAAQALNIEAWFIDYEYPEPQPDPPFHRAYSLHEVVSRILSATPCPVSRLDGLGMT